MTRPDGPLPPPPGPDVFSRMCTSREVFQNVTGRWGALVIVGLSQADGPVRFGAVRRKVDGISDRMLSQTLAQLEQDGLVVREVRSSIPPHVDYVLTEMGERMAEPLAELIGVIESELPVLIEARASHGEGIASRE